MCRCLRGAGDELGRNRSGFVNRVIAAMAVSLTRAAFLLDVGDFAARREFTVTPDDASTIQRPKSEEPHQTHRPILRLSSAASKRRTCGTHQCSVRFRCVGLT